MEIASELVVLDSANQTAAVCLVCGNDVAAGEGVTAVYRGQTIRFKCPRCFSRFEANPEPFLAGQTGGCCGGAHDHSPATEWSS